MGFWKGKVMFVFAGILISTGLFFADFVETAYAYTTVSSSITSDTVWTKENSPYVIQGPVYIPPSATLTVNPGAVVKFEDGGYGHFGNLTVDGILKADATPEDPIYFTSFRDDTVGGDTNGDGSATSPSIYNSQNWIKLNNAISPSTFNNVYIKYNYYGLWIIRGSHQITKTHLIKNDRGLYMQGGNIEVTGAEIADSGSYGVYAEGGNLTIKNSSIHNNTQGLYVPLSSNLAVSARNNWWGSALGPHHNVFNILGNGDKIGGDWFSGFTPWLTSEPTQQPENQPPTLLYSKETGYISDGVNPDSGSVNTNFSFKVVYTDLDNNPPSYIRVVKDETCDGKNMSLDLSAAPELRDGNYANGEQYKSEETFAVGNHSYYFDASDGTSSVRLPESSLLSFEVKTNETIPEAPFYVSVQNDGGVIIRDPLNIKKDKFDINKPEPEIFLVLKAYLKNDANAIKDFQCNYGYLEPAVCSGEGYGNLGPRTKQGIKKFLENIGVIKIVPNDWVLKAIEAPCQQGENCWWKVEDGGGLSGWMLQKYLSYSNSEDFSDRFLQINNSEFKKIVSDELNSVYDKYFLSPVKIKAEDFPIDIANAIILSESSASTNDIVSFDCGRGLMQVTTNAYVGEASNIQYFGYSNNKKVYIDNFLDKYYFPYEYIPLYKDGKIDETLRVANDYNITHKFERGNIDTTYKNCQNIGLTEEEKTQGWFYYGIQKENNNFYGRCKYYYEYDNKNKHYTNTKQGISANLKDGLLVLKDKYNDAKKRIEDGIKYGKWSLYRNLPTGSYINEKELKTYNEGDELLYMNIENKILDRIWWKVKDINSGAEGWMIASKKDGVIKFLNPADVNNKIKLISSIDRNSINYLPEKHRQNNYGIDKINYEDMKKILAIKAYNGLGDSCYRLNKENDYLTKVAENLVDNNDFANKLRLADENKQEITICSPGNIQIINSVGEIIGLVDGQLRYNESSIYYDESGKTATIYFPDNVYQYRNVGTDNGVYGLIITNVVNGEEINFTTQNIPTTPNQIHQYSIDWNALVNNEKGVTLQIDKEGDGTFEQTVNVGAELNDTIAPMSEILISGTEGNNNWHTSDVQIELSAKDNEGGVGVEKIEYSLDDGQTWNKYTGSFNMMKEGKFAVYCRGVDFFGNVEETKIADIKIDKSSPIIKGFITTIPNLNGWFNNDVAVYFESYDDVSGIDNVTPDTIITTEGFKQFIIGTAIDLAGNKSEFLVEGINIDKTPPVILINLPAKNGIYILNQKVSADWFVSDSLSEIESAEGTTPNGTAIDTFSVGEKYFTVTSKDKAGNSATKTLVYYAHYNYSGVLPPIKTDGSSVSKLGSTVPVKFQLKDANGNFISNALAYIYIAKISDIITGYQEAISVGEANIGNLFRYDSLDNQYIFNLGTKNLSVGTWQLSIKLDDGTGNNITVSLK